MTVLLWAVIGYACGCLPSAWLIAGLIKQREVLAGVRRDVGEADAHVLIQVHAGRASWSAAAMDVLKGFTPVVIALRVTGPYEIAACAVAAVCGHCWPPFLYRYAGRGLATAAGTFLAFLPVEMVVAGIVRVIGSFVRAGGLLSTVGFVAVPVVAWLRGQPMPYVVASAAINILIFLRRLEGMEEDIRSGSPLGRVLYRRAVLDQSARRVWPVP
jgi:acyl phosphate:glycerol-3-phosphate acyltransferase